MQRAKVFTAITDSELEKDMNAWLSAHDYAALRHINITTTPACRQGGETYEAVTMVVVIYNDDRSA
jgi:hypothetical protein